MEFKRPPPKRLAVWRLVLWFVLLWLVAAYFATRSGPDRAEIAYSAFRDRVEQGQVAAITVQGERITGRFTGPLAVGGAKGAGGAAGGSSGQAQGGGEGTRYERFRTTLPSFGDPELAALLRRKGVVVRAEATRSPWFVQLVTGLLPWLLLLGLFVYVSKRFRERMGGGQGPFGFGKSRAKLFDRTSSEVTFDDVAGAENAKKELTEVADYLREPGRYRALGGELPRGILLVGPPGTGKTLMARAVAGEADVPFYSISASEFIEMFVGVGASRVRDMFDKAKKDAPAIIFIDELDSIGRARGTGLGGGHDEREQTLNQILAEMDGFSGHESVVVLAATNRPDVLDPALVRPGRFDRKVTLDLPQREARKQILEIHTREVPLDDDVDLGSVAARTPGFSGADLRNLVNEAALLAARGRKEHVAEGDFVAAIDKIRLGVEREDLVNEDERKIVAYHEAGHTLVAKRLPGTDPVQQVSIVPRGGALGVTEQVPEEDRHNHRRSYLLERLAVLLGGRVAERIVFEDVTSGAADDLKQATRLARRMVCQWGMSDRLGPVAYRHGEQHPFLGRELTEARDFSDETARLIDQEVEKTVREMEERAEEVLVRHRRGLDALAEALLERETLGGEEIDRVLERAAESRPKG